MKILYTFALASVFILTGCAQTTTQDVKDDTNQVEQPQGEEQTNSNGQNNAADQTDNQEEEPANDASSEDQTNNQKVEDSFDKGRAEVVLTDYEKAFKMVVSYSTDEGNLKEYSTKPELKDHFLHFMTDELAQGIVDTYFEQKDDGLYVKAMDAPVFLQEGEPFTFTKAKAGTAIVLQERKNELIGHVIMEYTLMNRDGYWIVKEVNRAEPNQK